MSTDFSLRSIITCHKQKYIQKDGSINPFWKAEGCTWAIQEYHSSIGSLLDFTGDDLLAVQEEGVVPAELKQLCGEADDYWAVAFDSAGQMGSVTASDYDYAVRMARYYRKHHLSARVYDVLEYRALLNSVRESRTQGGKLYE